MYKRQDLVKQIKEVERGRISEYAKRKEGVDYHDGRGVWSVPVDIALPVSYTHLDVYKRQLLYCCSTR